MSNSSLAAAEFAITPNRATPYSSLASSQKNLLVHRKGHNFVQKDYYRHLKTDKHLEKHMEKKKA